MSFLQSLLPKKVPRLFGWLVATIVLLVFIALLFPQQFTVSLYKLSLVTLAAVVGYWLDRDLFPYARPDCFLKARDGIQCDEECIFPTAADIGIAYTESDLGLADAIRLAAAMIRRALIVSAAMLAIGLGA